MVVQQTLITIGGTYEERGQITMEFLDQCYTVTGTGGWETCMVIQDELEAHGLCSCFRWEPDPSRAKRDHVNWRFFYETNLRLDAIQDLLEHYVLQHKVQLR